MRHHGEMARQQCAHQDCNMLAAFGTRTKPAWCDQHITEILARGGLDVVPTDVVYAVDG
jgi:hypothetical protein